MLTGDDGKDNEAEDFNLEVNLDKNIQKEIADSGFNYMDIEEVVAADTEKRDEEEIYNSSLLNVSSNMNLYNIELDKLIDAPRDWNFFPPLDEVKFEELINSIQINGLLVPLVVWDQGNGKYMILSGHNRKRAYETLYERTSDKKYKRIFCTIKNADEIDIEDAKNIIIDTNFVQRELSPSIKSKCIIEKYKSLGRKKYGANSASPTDIISEQYNLKRSQIFLYYKLRNLIPQLADMLDNKKISLKAAAILADLRPEFQLQLYNNYRSYLVNNLIMKIDKNKSEEEILADLTKTDKVEEQYITVTNTIPKNKYNDFIRYVDEWLRQNA